MRMFFDSSAFAKRFILEKGSRDVDSICLDASELALSIICFPEIISALNRRKRENNISEWEYSIAKTRLLDDVNDTTIINLTSNVIAQSTRLLESNPLRAMDSLHIACAIEWDTELFVSADRNQIRAAKNAGLKVRYV